MGSTGPGGLVPSTGTGTVPHVFLRN